MYLTKIIFNMKNRYVIRNIANCNWVHKFILEKGFGSIEGSDIRKTLNVLYFIDGNSLIVQSAVKPDFEADMKVMDVPPRTIEIDKMQTLFKNGNVLHFTCNCNPTKRNTNGKRVFLITQGERSEWFRKTMERNGAEILTESQGPESTVWGVKKEGEGSNRIYAKAVKFYGALKVTDGEKLWEAFCKGVGHEKAYGCGMLQITK